MSNRDELAVLIAKHHDKFFGVEYAEPATQDIQLADELLAAGYTKPHTITEVAELDALPRNSIVAVLTHSRNVPITVVFQRGSNSEGGGGWCTPEAMGQITSEQVFEYIGLNCLPYEFTVLHEGAGA